MYSGTYQPHWDIYPEMKLLLGREISLFSVLLNIAQLFSKVVVVVHFLTSGIGEFLLLYVFFNTCYCQTLKTLAI